MNDNNSILDNIIKKDDKDSSVINFYHNPILPQVIYKSELKHEKGWMITQQNGMSEDENSQSHI